MWRWLRALVRASATSSACNSSAIAASLAFLSSSRGDVSLLVRLEEWYSDECFSSFSSMCASLSSDCWLTVLRSWCVLVFTSCSACNRLASSWSRWYVFSRSSHSFHAKAWPTANGSSVSSGTLLDCLGPWSRMGRGGSRGRGGREGAAAEGQWEREEDEGPPLEEEDKAEERADSSCAAICLTERRRCLLTIPSSSS